MKPEKLDILIVAAACALGVMLVAMAVSISDSSIGI